MGQLGMGINRRINICLCFHIALINLQTYSELRRRYFSLSSSDSSRVSVSVSVGFCWVFGISCLLTDFAFARFYLIASPVAHEEEEEEEHRGTGVRPGQAVAATGTSGWLVCSINTNFNWKTIQLTKSVKRFGRRDSATLLLWRPLSVCSNPLPSNPDYQTKAPTTTPVLQAPVPMPEVTLVPGLDQTLFFVSQRYFSQRPFAAKKFRQTMRAGTAIGKWINVIKI